MKIIFQLLKIERSLIKTYHWVTSPVESLKSCQQRQLAADTLRLIGCGWPQKLVQTGTPERNLCDTYLLLFTISYLWCPKKEQPQRKAQIKWTKKINQKIDSIELKARQSFIIKNINKHRQRDREFLLSPNNPCEFNFSKYNLW